jgi:hypothetical protein
MAKEQKNYYDTPKGKMWRVTSILGIIDKSGPLMWWAAKCASQFIAKEVRRVLAEHGKKSITPDSLDEICKRAISEYRSVKDDAADIGTQVHKLIEEYCYSLLKKVPFRIPDKSDDEWLDPRVINAFGLFLQWAEEVELEPVQMETFLFHPLHEYAGTGDLLARGKFNKKWKKKRLYYLDIKTCKAIYETAEMQIASYVEAYRSMPDGKKVEGEGIIRVGKDDGKPEFKDCTDNHYINFERFLGCLKLHMLMKGRPA